MARVRSHHPCQIPRGEERGRKADLSTEQEVICFNVATRPINNVATYDSGLAPIRGTRTEHFCVQIESNAIGGIHRFGRKDLLKTWTRRGFFFEEGRLDSYFSLISINLVLT